MRGNPKDIAFIPKFKLEEYNPFVAEFMAKKELRVILDKEDEIKILTQDEFEGKLKIKKAENQRLELIIVQFPLT